VIENNKTTVQGGVRTSDVLENATFWTQFTLLSDRAFKNAWRNKLMLKGRFMQTVILALIFGAIFSAVPDDQRGVQDRTGALFMIAVNGVMGSTMGVVSIFAVEKLVFLREFQSGMYRLPAYFLSRTIVELPFKIIFPIIGSNIFYWLVGLQRNGGNFLIYVITLILIENVGTGLGVFMASFFNDIGVALTVLPLFLMPLMIFSGFFVNEGTVVQALSWIKWISPMKYGFVALVLNEFTGLELHCLPNQLNNGVCPITNGEQEIHLLGFESEGSIVFNILILLLMWFVLMSLAYLALWRQLKNSR